MLELFKRLVETPGGSGFEEEVIKFVADELKKRVRHISVDPIGNVIGRLGTDRKLLMVCVHSEKVFPVEGSTSPGVTSTRLWNWSNGLILRRQHNYSFFS